MKPDTYVCMENLNNGLMRGDHFPEGRLSPFVLNEFLKMGKIKKILTPAELKMEYKNLEKIFRPGTET